MLAILPEQIDREVADLQILIDVCCTHYLPLLKRQRQIRYSDSLAEPGDHIEHFSLLVNGTITFEYFKRPDRMIDQHEEHVPESPVGNIGPALSFHYCVDRIHRIDRFQGAGTFCEHDRS